MFTLCFPDLIFAERIVLKSGKVIEAEIIERTSDYIKVREGMVYVTYLLNRVKSINGEEVEPATITSQVTRVIPAPGGSSFTKQADEFFVEQCLDYFKNDDYASFYGEMSTAAKKTEYEDMVILFSAEEEILGPLIEYRKLDRVPPAGSSSPPTIKATFTYVCVFNKWDGSAIVDVVTEKNRLKINRFKILSAGFLTDEAKTILDRANAKIDARATLRTLSDAFESYTLTHNNEYPTDVDAQLINARPQYLTENYFTKCTVTNSKPCDGYVYGHDNFTISSYNMTARPVSCSPKDSKSFTVVTGGNLTTDKNCTAAR